MEAKKPILNLGFGTGNPASCPDFKPENPWGRPMPRYDKMYPPVPPSHQVHVMQDGKLVPVGPMMGKEFCEAFCVAIGNQIALGNEKRWSLPHVVKLL